MKKIVTFGEIMMRLNPPGYLRFLQTDTYEATYAGGEANVAVSLANFKNDVAYVTKVPENEIGQSAINALRRYGVDTSMMLVGGPRLGIYFCEKGASQRGSKVIYDRAGSSIAVAKREDFDWDAIFEGVLVPLHRDHTGARRRHARSLPGRLQGGQGEGNHGIL